MGHSSNVSVVSANNNSIAAGSAEPSRECFVLFIVYTVASLNSVTTVIFLVKHVFA